MRWIVIILYTALIYSTLGVARDITNKIRDIGNLEVITISSVALFLLILIFSNIREISKKQLLYRIVLTLCFIGVILTVTEFPEEKMHVIEYGLLGWLIAWAISSSSPVLFYHALLGLLLGWCIGFGDEIIQYFLPNRFYDIRDVALNGISVTIGLLYYLSSLHRNPN
jgi:VanZ family protein